MSDGRIVIDTKIDTSGAESGYSSLKSKVARLAHEYQKSGMNASEAWKKAWSEIERSSGTGSQKVISDMSNIHSKGSMLLGGTVALAGTALATLGGFALKTGIEFESAFAGVKKTVNASTAQLETLRTGIINMSNQMPEAATQIAGVAEAAGQLGIRTQNILGFTKTMVMLGDSTDMSSEQAATALARLANITGMPQTQFDRLGSTIVALGNNMATTESEIVEMGLRLAGAGHQVGMTEAQIMSFSAALSSVGISAEEGGSAFSRVMVQMQLASEKGGKSLEQFAQVAGMSAGQFKREFKENASQAILHFIQGLSKMKGQGKSAIKVLDDMGIKDVRLRDTLLRASGASGEFTKALNIGNKAWKDNTALTNEASQRYETTASKLKILKNNIISIGISIFEKFQKPIKKALDVAIKNIQLLQAELQSSSIVSSLENIAGGFGKLIEIVSKLTTSILPPLISVLGWILSHGSIIAASILGITAAIKTFSVVNKTVATITKMRKAWDEAKLAMALFEMSSKSMSLSEAVLTGTLTMQETIVGLLTGKIKLATVAQRIWNATVKANPVGFLISAIIALITIFATLWATSERFRNFWIGLWNSIKNIVHGAVNGIKNGLNALGISISGTFNKIHSAIKTLETNIKNTIGPILIVIAEKAKQAWNGFIEIINKLKEKFAFLEPVISSIGHSLVNSFTTARGLMLTIVALVSKIGLRFLGITGPIGMVASLVITLASSFLKISGFSAEGITKTFNDLGNKISQVGDTLTKNLPKFIEAGTRIITNIADGISKNLPKLINTASKIIENITNGITNALPKIINIAANLIDTFANYVSNNLPKLIDLGINILNKIVDGIVATIPKLINIATKIIERFTQSFVTNLPKLIDAGVKILDKIVQGITNAIPKLLPVVVTIIQTILTNFITNLPKFIETGGKIILALIGGIGFVMFKLAGVALKLIITLAKSLIMNLPKIIAAGVKLIIALIQGIAKILPKLIIMAIKIIFSFQKALITNLPKILMAGVKILMALIKGVMKIIPQLIVAALKIIMTLAKALITNLPKILMAGVQIVGALIKGIGSFIGQLLELGVKLVVQLATGIASNIGLVISKAVEIGSKFLSTIVSWFCQLPGQIYNWLINAISKVSSWGSQMYSKAIETGSKFITGIINWFRQLPSRIWTWLSNSAGKVGAWGSSLWERGKSAAGQLVHAVIDTVSSIPSKMVSIGKNIVEGVWNGITGAAGWFADKVHGFFSGIVDGAKKALGIHSPARKMIPVGDYTVQGMEVGVKNRMPKLKENMKDELFSLTNEMKATVQAENADTTKGFYTKSNYSSVSQNITNNKGLTQNITFNKPVETPSETARRIKQVGRDLLFG